MSKTKFSPALFEQLGGMHWSTRPDGAGFVQHAATSSQPSVESVGAETSSAELVSYHVESEQSSLAVNEAPVSSASYSYDEPTQALPENSAAIEVAESQETIPLSDPLKRYIVVLGAELDAVWQNEESQAWLLWQNIMLAFGWDESEIVFFDTANLVSDEMVFSTMEEIIELGVDWVLTMDEEHIISEQLQEGVHVVNVPDLELMLSDPYSKQTFYHSVMATTASL